VWGETERERERERERKSARKQKHNFSGDSKNDENILPPNHLVTQSFSLLNCFRLLLAGWDQVTSEWMFRWAATLTESPVWIKALDLKIRPYGVSATEFLTHSSDRKRLRCSRNTNFSKLSEADIFIAFSAPTTTHVFLPRFPSVFLLL
jgi:hypothetical protein